MLQTFGEEIWVFEGSPVEVLGFRYPTRMAIIRLSTGGLFVWSPVAWTTKLHEAVIALGDVRFLIAPNHLHHLHLAEWKEKYPTALIHAAPRLQAKRPDLVIDEVLSEQPSGVWSEDIEQEIIKGNRITTEVVFFHRASGTVVFADLLQQFPADWFGGWRGVVARLDGMVGQVPAVPRKFRLAFHDRDAARRSIERILEWPVKQVLMAHGLPVQSDAVSFLKQAFRWLR